MNPESAISQTKDTRVELAGSRAVQAEQQSPYLRLFKSNVFVRDYDRALKFYVDQLGFSVLAESRFEFGRWMAIAPPDGSAILALVAPNRGSERLQAHRAANADCFSSPKTSLRPTIFG